MQTILNIDSDYRQLMADSVSEMRRQDVQCEELLECFHGLKRMDKEVFRLPNDVDEPLTVDELAEEIDRERSTAYRPMQRLMTAGLIEKEQVNYDQGGYYHVYRATPTRSPTTGSECSTTGT